MVLIKNAIVLTMNNSREVIRDGAIAIDGENIKEVGKTQELVDKYQYDEVIDGRDKLVMPGFVAAHVHLFQTLYRGMGDDMCLSDWLRKCIFPLSEYLDEEASCVGAELSSVELLRSGVTTYVDSHYINHDKRVYDGIARGTLNTGIRGVIGRSSVNNTAASLPKFCEDIDTAQRECARVIETYHNYGDGLLNVRVEPLNEFSATSEMIVAMHDVAKQYHVGMSMHLAESRDRYDGVMEKYGMTPVCYLDKLGVLGKETLLAHCVWLNAETDLPLLKSSGTSVVYNSVSNQYLADGIADVQAMLDAGITVALGPDGAASNNSLNMFGVLKSAVLLQRAKTLDVFSLTAERALEMATIDGAKAIGMEDKIGSLEPGKRADILMLDLNDLTMTPKKSCISTIVYSANTTAVDTVIVDGKIVMKKSEFVFLDEHAVYAKANDTLEWLIQKSNYAFSPCKWPVR